MSQWLVRLRQVLPGIGDPRRAVRTAFERARRRTRRLELETVSPDGSRGDLLLTTIEQVREDDIVINRPTIGSTIRPLVTGEPLLACVSCPEGRKLGRTRCLGRIKIPSGSAEGDVIYGYRLAIPETLDDAERREYQRMPVEFDLAPQAELLLPRRGTLLRGILVDLSIGGVRMRCSGGFNMLNKGDEALLKTTLPEPVGELSQFVVIKRVEECHPTGHCLTSMAFRRPVDAIGPLVQQLKLRRLRPRRAG